MSKKTQIVIALVIGIVSGQIYRDYLDQKAVYPKPEKMFINKTEWIVVEKPCVEEKKEEKKETPIEQRIADTFPECPDIALAVAIAESKLNPRAFNGNNRNGSVDRGIFQVNSIHGHGDELFDVETNLKVARKIYDKSGWKAWSAYNNGAYLKHLK